MLDVVPASLGFITPSLCFLAGVSAFLAFYHFVLFLRDRRRMQSLLIAAVCVSIVGYDASALMAYRAVSVSEMILAVRLLVLFGCAIIVPFMWSVALRTRVMPVRFLTALSIGFAGLFAANALLPGGVMFAHPAILQQILLPWGETITKPLGAFSLWMLMGYALIAAYQCFMAYACFIQYRRGERGEALGLAVYVFLLMVCSLFDLGVDQGVIAWCYLTEYSFLALAVYFSILMTTHDAQAVQISEALRTTEDQYRVLFEQAGDYILVMRLTPDGGLVITDVNESACQIHGYTRNELIGMSITDLDTHMKPESSKKLLEQAMSGLPLRFETVHRRKDGSTFPVEVCTQCVQLDGKPHFMSVERDITERKQAEMEVLESGERFSSIFYALTSIVALTDYETGHYLDVNEAWVRTSGVSREDAIGKTGKELGFWRGASDREHIFKLLARQGRAENVEILINIRESLVPFVMSATRVDMLGRPCVLWELNDISARKQAEAEQEQLRAQLLQSQKMEAVGQLAGGVAHDFNNLLQVIHGYTDMALEELGKEHPTRDSLLQVSAASEKAATLVGQLLAFSRRQIMRPENLNLNTVIEHLLKMLQRIVGEHIQYDFLPGHQLGTVHADRGMVEQVVMNLVINARDAMGSEGALTIETGNVLIDEDFCKTNTWATPGRYVLLTVTDTGCGMDDETVARIFEPFFTTKDKSKGSGLGLATVYGIVRQHDGMIRAYSELGKGSAFKVYLPVAERLAQHVVARGKTLSRGGAETILLAEDDDSVRALAVRILEHAGYTVLATANGQEAVNLFQKRAGDVDLLVLDVVMPQLGGREVFEQAAAIKPGIPALFASGYSENAIHANFVLKEGMKLIQKPYNAQDLLRQVRDILDADIGTSLT